MKTKKTIKSVLFAVIILFTFSTTAFATSGDPSWNYVFLSVNGSKEVYIRTAAPTVKDFLEIQDIRFEDGDYVSHSLDKKIESQMTINYVKALSVVLYIDDVKEIVKTQKTTIGKLMTQQSARLGKALSYDESLAMFMVKDGTVLEAYTKSYETVYETEVIPFIEESVMKDDMPKGETSIVQQGINGETVTQYKVTLENGEEIERVVVEANTTIEMVKQIVHIGTAQAIPAGTKTFGGVLEAPLVYEKKMLMNATAYTANFACTGKNPGDKYFGITASGMKARVGVVAVDPKVIPLGTELFIDGYGYAIAGDTGGAIKGNKIDLYFDSYEQCLIFGRRNLDVYILK